MSGQEIVTAVATASGPVLPAWIARAAILSGMILMTGSIWQIGDAFTRPAEPPPRLVLAQSAVTPSAETIRRSVTP